MKHIIAVKERAAELRRQGFLYSSIAEQLNIAKSTAYAWLKDLEYSEEELVSIKETAYKSQLSKVSHLALHNKNQYELKKGEIAENAKQIVDGLTFSNKQEALICAILFWCEGGKNVSAGIQFINSDPIMIRTFLSLLRSSFSLNESKFRALVHLHEYHDPVKQLNFWSDTTAIPIKQFHKSYLKMNTGKNIHKGYQGCVSIRYLDASLGKLLQMIYTEFGLKYRGVR